MIPLTNNDLLTLTTAVCWGKNDTIIVGNKDGTITIYQVVTPAQAERISTIPVPEALEEGQSYAGN